MGETNNKLIKKKIVNYVFKTALLIDDNDIDNIINKMIIVKCKFAKTIIAKESSEEAIDFLRNDAIAKNQIPDIIFLDIRMPLMNCFEFLEMYKDLPKEILDKSSIVVLTSSLDDKDYAEAIENRFVKFLLNKPLTFESLEYLERILEVVNSRNVLKGESTGGNMRHSAGYK